MKRFKIFSLLFLSYFMIQGLNSCSDSDPEPTNPTPPQLGTQIDRTGRPAISTALIQTFQADSDIKGMEKDFYNSALPTSWNGFTEEIATNLAIYDALDIVCGNQILAGPDAVAGRYDTLASVLANDQLIVNSASGDCSQYLAVEADVTGLLENDLCGGRTPLMDVVDTTYSVVAIGDFSGVTDGIDSDTVTHSLVNFPFLADPI